MADVMCRTGGCETMVPVGTMCPVCFQIAVSEQIAAFPVSIEDMDVTSSSEVEVPTAPIDQSVADESVALPTANPANLDRTVQPCVVCGEQNPGAGPSCAVCGSPLNRTSSAESPTGNGCSVILPGGTSFELTEGQPVILGRESPVAVIAGALAALDTVSRRHALVTLVGHQVELSDMGSANGTFVDSRQLGSVSVKRSLPVKVGLGRSVEVEIR